MSELTPLRESLLRHLADGQFHSGEQLGEALNVSRAAVSKHVQALKGLGLDVYSVSGKGYRLAVPLQLLDPARLAHALAPAQVEVVPVIGSTNQYWLESVERLNKGDVCLAECQTSGRGRRGRSWVSPFGGQLIMSLYWRLEQGMAAAMGLSLVVGIAAVEALENAGFAGVELKWPNDLYLNGRKLAGILVEMSGTAGGPCHLVIGMGLNLVLPESEQERITQPWAELAELGEISDRNGLVIALINGWQQALLRFEQEGIAGFRERWNRLDYFNGKPVRVLMGEQEVQGTARGIDDQGALLLELESGEVKRYLGGEISLRGNNRE
ncbi:bifunctional biotin--[acetyl-CoA-carboxylase] ligase/biotin operon repressor BirA [Oceanimonas sp. CHS3-5]|uniref:bifunctional biotin--[acetyl-CoA-carboxylase] ligase/biotin operon repressor BirA n=1 Tax=Oceanimonas sp. CHS3-5 TaxID=3068186 RepID=UPI00273E42C1|nr:bifunctional biotin--[acetyl-CoA-carboxylase] ligase/biotin operon repressor BirA [Oceanimonas sp. CHS3-5]MDP5293671.1 bifunctional biotin--[acetyl-CoA-carboxylase] ligase/biotin operon repressor BirA [Oceanimonas sp. CHS3-5]